MASRKARSEKESGRSTGLEASRPLERYVSILEILAAFREGLLLTEIAGAAGITKSTAHRLLGALQASDLVQATGSGHTFVLGPRFHRLIGSGAEIGWLTTLLAPHLKALIHDIGDCCAVSRLAGHAIRIVCSDAPAVQWRSYVQPTAEVAPHASASARAILAFQPEELIGRVLPAELPALTRETITSRRKLLAEYAKVRQTGFATCVGEVDEGLAAVAVPIWVPPMGAVYSVGVLGPRQRIMDSRLEARVEKLKAASARMADALGTGFLLRPHQDGDREAGAGADKRRQSSRKVA
jgi:DNA-binding IclR family transcriptional regulator